MDFVHEWQLKWLEDLKSMSRIGQQILGQHNLYPTPQIQLQSSKQTYLALTENVFLWIS